MYEYGNNLSYISREAGSGQAGFTLLELLIVMLIGAIIMTAVMTSFISQHRAYLAQDEMVGMNQNLRAAMDLMTREIRMAGYGAAGAGFIAPPAADDEIEFRIDVDEWVKYTLENDASIARSIKTAGSWSTSQPVADNFEHLEFNYIEDGGNKTLNPSPAADIRGVQISLLARTGNADPDYTDTHTYVSGSGAVWGPFNDGFRRRLMVRTVMCRNLGLQ